MTARNRLGQFAPRRKAKRAPKRTRNPSPMTLPEIRRHVAGEASTSRGHHALAIAHRHESNKAWARGHFTASEDHQQMADAHEHVSGALAALERVTRAQKVGRR